MSKVRMSKMSKAYISKVFGVRMSKKSKVRISEVSGVVVYKSLYDRSVSGLITC